MRNLTLILVSFALIKFYSIGVGPYCKWRIEYQNLDNGRYMSEELPLANVTVKVKAIEFNQETYDPKTKTVNLTTSRFY